MAKKKLTKKILEYVAVFEPAEEGGYVVSVPALPGCATEGDTFEEAAAMAKDAVRDYLEVLHKSQQEIPLEKPGVIITRVAVARPVL